MKVFISAGDVSGDMHAADLVRALKNIGGVSVTALGGNKLKEVLNSAAGDVFIKDIVNVGAFGFFPWRQYFFLRKTFNYVKTLFKTDTPQKVILVDYYGFNIHIAALAKKLNIPVYYYVSPQVWASRRWRINTIAKYVKKMLTILPFEEALYKSYGVDAEFVGNPLIDSVPAPQVKDIDLKNITIGLFPGSRASVIKRHMPILLESAKIICESLNAKFVVFSDKPLNCTMPDYISIDAGGSLASRAGLDFVICPSGTVSLENALLGLPMAIMYKVSFINYVLAKLLIKINYIAMVNILQDKYVVPEFLQYAAKPKNIAEFVINAINSGSYKKTQSELLEFRKMLGQQGVAARAAKIIYGG
ncbi:MAG: hypothetical protein FWC85_03805 [Elusimicrobia bacterium]|nr:hypothetical protein [Elusimicrobiota bacterium]